MISVSRLGEFRRVGHRIVVYYDARNIESHLFVSNCRFSRRIQDWATLPGARYLPYADADT
jgi:hypothetical protein